MEYQTSEDLKKYFKDEIEESSNKKVKALQDEIDEIKKIELEKLEKGLHESINHDLELQLKDLETDHAYEMNQLLSLNAKKLMNKRQELIDDVFESVKQKIEAYVKTKEYQTQMKSKLSKLNDIFKDDEIIFSIKKGDKRIKEVIVSSYQDKASLEESSLVQLGGFFAACPKKGIELDETLDRLLEDKKQWFYEKSNLYIKK